MKELNSMIDRQEATTQMAHEHQHQLANLHMEQASQTEEAEIIKKHQNRMNHITTEFKVIGIGYKDKLNECEEEIVQMVAKATRATLQKQRETQEWKYPVEETRLSTPGPLVQGITLATSPEQSGVQRTRTAAASQCIQECGFRPRFPPIAHTLGLQRRRGHNVAALRGKPTANSSYAVSVRGFPTVHV